MSRSKKFRWLVPRLVILIYHRVLDARDPLRPYDVDVLEFEKQIRALSRWYVILPLREALGRLTEGTLPRGAVSITFDDGYADNLKNALPILQRYGVAATVYIATGYCNGGVMFNDLVIEAIRNCRSDSVALPNGKPVKIGSGVADRLRALSEILPQIKTLEVAERRRFAEKLAADNGVRPDERLMLNGDQVRALRASGVEIGAHTVEHPILSVLSAPDAEAEMRVSKATLEQWLQEDVKGFAYPNGRPGRDFGERDVELAKTVGFEYAVTTEWSAADSDVDLYQVPRISIGTAAGWRPLAGILRSKIGL